MNDHEDNKPDFLKLKQLGLSHTAIACYEALYVNGPQTVGDLAKFIKKPCASAYYALSQLERKGFVDGEKIEIFHQVTRFRAIRLDKALENLAIYQRRAVQGLVDYQVGRSIRQQAGLKTPVSRKDWR